MIRISYAYLLFCIYLINTTHTTLSVCHSFFQKLFKAVSLFLRGSSSHTMIIITHTVPTMIVPVIWLCVLAHWLTGWLAGLDVEKDCHKPYMIRFLSFSFCFGFCFQKIYFKSERKLKKLRRFAHLIDGGRRLAVQCVRGRISFWNARVIITCNLEKKERKKHDIAKSGYWLLDRHSSFVLKPTCSINFVLLLLNMPSFAVHTTVQKTTASISYRQAGNHLNLDASQ